MLHCLLDWSERAKQITKLWRKVPSEQRAPYLASSYIADEFCVRNFVSYCVCCWNAGVWTCREVVSVTFGEIMFFACMLGFVNCVLHSVGKCQVLYLTTFT